MKVGTLSAAIKTCETMGWGFDIQYPQQKWHVKKNYVENFAWKGEPKETQEYD